MTNSNTTKALLTCGVASGIVYVGLALLQIAIRPGFDVTRHALSLMANGDLGWIQTTNFLLCGLLTILGPIGIRRATRPGKASFWGCLLLGVYGLSLFGAAAFPADPALGFPVGTAADEMTITARGIMHFVCGGIGFLALIASTFVFAGRFARAGEKRWAAFSVATGVLFFAAFFGIAAGAGNPALTVAFYLAVILAWSWISLLCATIRREVRDDALAAPLA